MTSCLDCKHWNLRDSGEMAAQGYARCNLGPRWQFNAPQHACPKHEPAPAAAVEKRKAVLRDPR